jgi:four helix bundle protein
MRMKLLILFFFILALILIVHILNLLIMKFEFQNLTIYKKAKEFHQAAKSVIADKDLKSYEKDQLSRASFSIILNNAECSGRFSKKDRQNFFVITRSSVFECVAILDVLKDKHVLSHEEFEKLESMADELSRILYAMIKNLS